MGIYIRDGERLEPMEEEPFDYEEDLQALVAKHPELLEGALISPENPRRWALVTREQGIAATLGDSDWWAVDHLFVDQDAMPTLVEAKLGANSEVRRKVVGQMLDYAAHAVQTWTAERLRETFNRTCEESGKNPSQVLGELLQADAEPDEDAFWEEVATNLATKRIRLLFVADAVPEPLERVVGFLNEQMPNIQVLAVEIKQFKGTSSQMLVPRVIGRTAASDEKQTGRKRTKVTREEFMAKLPNDAVRDATDRLLSVAGKHRIKPTYGDRGLSIRIQLRNELWRWPVTVAWLFPPSNTAFWSGLWGYSFGAAILSGYIDQPGHELQTVLQDWIREFEHDPFGTNIVYGTDVWAHAIDHDEVAPHIDLLADRLDRVLADLRAL